MFPNRAGRVRLAETAEAHRAAAVTVAARRAADVIATAAAVLHAPGRKVACGRGWL